MMIIYEIDPVLTLIISVCVLSQSIFGVGVLLWGTPALLLYGLDYVTTICLLLPISFVISTFQVISSENIKLRSPFLKFLYFCLPLLLVGLTLILIANLDATLFVICGLLFAGFLRISSPNRLRDLTSDNKDLLLPLIGFIHGVSNLGGSVLVVWASLSASTKEELRTLVGLIYSCLALSQIIVIFLNLGQFKFFISYILPAILVNLICSKFLFQRLNEAYFQRLLTLLIFAMALLLIIKLVIDF